MRQYSIPSIFIFYEVSTYTTLLETLISNILDIRILVSAERNRNLFQIRLLPLLVYQNIIEKASHTMRGRCEDRDSKTNTGLRSEDLRGHSDQSPRTYLRRSAGLRENQR